AAQKQRFLVAGWVQLGGGSTRVGGGRQLICWAQGQPVEHPQEGEPPVPGAQPAVSAQEITLEQIVVENRLNNVHGHFSSTPPAPSAVLGRTAAGVPTPFMYCRRLTCFTLRSIPRVRASPSRELVATTHFPISSVWPRAMRRSMLCSTA